MLEQSTVQVLKMTRSSSAGLTKVCNVHRAAHRLAVLPHIVAISRLPQALCTSAYALYAKVLQSAKHTLPLPAGPITSCAKRPISGGHVPIAPTYLVTATLWSFLQRYWQSQDAEHLLCCFCTCINIALHSFG